MNNCKDCSADVNKCLNCAETYFLNQNNTTCCNINNCNDCSVDIN